MRLRTIRHFVPVIFLVFMGYITHTTAAAEAEGKHLFILSGQSNMREPLIGSFKQLVTRALGADKVIVASYGQPGQPIHGWYKNWQPPENWQPTAKYVTPKCGGIYESLIGTVKQAVGKQEIASVTLVWMQGEEDARMGWASVYEKSFDGLLDQLRTDLNRKDINFVVGRINDFWVTGKKPGNRGLEIKDGDAMRELLVKIAESHPNSAWIDTDDLNTGVNPWGGFHLNDGHFPPAGYRVLGQRFARKALKLATPDTVIDETWFDAVFIDDVQKIKSHAAIDKMITGTTPDEKHAGGKSGLNVLLDGRYGSEDFTEPAWLRFPLSDQPVEFTIDLGAAADITAIAMNLLLNPKAKAHFPKSMMLSASKDGTNYTNISKGVGFAILSPEESTITKSMLVLYETTKVEARYVKIQLLPDVADKEAWLFLDEIIINPVTK